MDIISNDPGGAAGGWSGPRLPRWARFVAFGGAMISLLGYVATHRLATPEDSSAAWQSVRPIIGAGPTIDGTLTGRPGFGPFGLRMLFGGTDPRVIDLDTGGEHPIPGIPRSAGSSVYLSAMRGAVLANVVDNELVGAYLIRPGRPAERLGRTAGYAMPGRDGTTVISFDFQQQDGMVVSGRSIDGRRQWQWRTRALALPVRDTAAGLLLRQQTEGPDGLVLVRRETGQVLRRFPGIPVAQGDDSVVSVAPVCRPRCTLVRTRLDTGATTRFALPTDLAPDFGVISPDGRWLALAFRAGFGESGTTAAVLDLRTGAAWPVPGVWAPGSMDSPRATAAWSADAQSLVVAVRVAANSVQVGVWRPDVPLEPVTVLPHRFAGAPFGLATLP
jgi:hypothetical protein